MRVTLFKLNNRPDDFAVSKTCEFSDDGPYFLDFSRPLGKMRWFGFLNSRIGFVAGLAVPVIHAGEKTGELVISVGCADPYFPDILRLWKERYPSKMPPPVVEVGGLQRIADFAVHFPDDCKT